MLQKNTKVKIVDLDQFHVETDNLFSNNNYNLGQTLLVSEVKNNDKRKSYIYRCGAGKEFRLSKSVKK